MRYLRCAAHLIMLASIILCLSACSQRFDNDRLQQSIIQYADNNYSENGITIDLSDFTWFDWDKAIVFRAPVTNQEIENALEAEYNGSLDMLSGIIFSKDGEIVYEEFFRSTYSGIDALPPQLTIYHSSDINAKPHYKIISADDDIFFCVRKESGDYSYYVLTPSKLS